MKEAYIKCLKKLREFRKSLNTENDLKRGKLYFTWIRDKTKKIENEKDIDYIYKNIVQIDNIYRFKDMIRWANITRMKKVSILRLKFNGTIGKVDGKYLSTINEKIRTEFFE